MYDFKCQECGFEFERIVLKYEDNQEVPCPKCQAPSSTFMPLGSRNNVKFLFNYLSPDA